MYLGGAARSPALATALGVIPLLLLAAMDIRRGLRRFRAG